MRDGDLTLDGVLDGIWSTLTRARADAKHAWRYPAFCTINADGWPAARTVGLREVVQGDGRLAIHTDVRSAKIDELLAEPRCSLMFYNSRTQEQLRVTGFGVVRSAGDTQKVWEQLPARQHHNYSVQPEPGSEIESWDSYAHGTDEAVFASHFRVIDVSIRQMDWIRLDRPVDGIGHKRASFYLSSGDAKWLVP
ncbi:MAG: pyridoxamine 5'-phosphate oxidase family protein [Pseudomonadota bacterium]